MLNSILQANWQLVLAKLLSKRRMTNCEDDGRQDDEVEELRKRGRPVGANWIYKKVDHLLWSNTQVLVAICEPLSYEEAISCKEYTHTGLRDKLVRWKLNLDSGWLVRKHCKK